METLADLDVVKVSHSGLLTFVSKRSSKRDLISAELSAELLVNKPALWSSQRDDEAFKEVCFCEDHGFRSFGEYL